MSLTRVIDTSHVKRFLNDHIRKPDVPRLAPPVVPLTDGLDPGLMGTAFDLLLSHMLRVRVGAHGAVTAPGRGLDCLWMFAERGYACPLTMDVAIKRFKKARNTLSAYDGVLPVPPEVADAVVYLARVAIIYRSWFLWTGWRDKQYRQARLLAPVAPAMRDELTALVSIVPWDRFVGRVCVNPEFGEGSLALGGADGDLLVDDAIIDVKTVSRSIGIEDVRQVVGYALLANRFGVDRYRPVKVERVGVYLSRRGDLRVFDLRDCIHDGSRDQVLDYLLAQGRVH